ncbi:fatty acid metabolism transcriptional regulator FadR [Haemophilus haemolyticus]|jgi:fatty acid metabolism transcriptional regulator fadR|uniref:fatty acid metabolism transcriptional regulator FadR n=1 Tax=Haemophilus haemolyticus TaxID=726 RepID=UPI000E5962C6|nr:fatty acid metabolism transcriptional regulator FadR [Haemophilus haemolyticus]
MQHDNDILKAQSPAALAEEYIVKSIWQDVFPAGSNLPSERDLADKIGVTRTTLREVLQRLARDGWLTIQHGKPTKVNNIWDTAGPNIIETLIGLDMQSAPLIIDNMLSLRSKMSESYIYEAVKNSPQQSAALFAELDQLQNTAQDYTEFDYKLFRQFTVVANKPFYRLIFNSLKGVYQRIGFLFFKEEKHRELTKTFYLEMQQICLAGNADAVVDCIRKHNLRSSTYWKAILERLPQNLSE